MNIESIPSAVPDWFDPGVPGFSLPDSWTGCRVRVKVPVTTADPAKETAEARAVLEKKFPGASLHIVQDFDFGYAPSAPSAGTDEDMLRAYFATATMPEGSTAEQAVAYLGTLLPGSGLFGVQAASFIGAEATNVLGFRSASVDMSRGGLTLVTGTRPDRDGKSNGAGKSTWVGLSFLGLTGRTFKGQECDAWASRHNDRPASLDTKMKLPDGRILHIVRQRRPARLQVTLDGVDVTMGTPAATQKLVEQLTNLTWDVLTNAVYVGQHEAASVFGTDKERKELFSRLLGLNRFLDAQARLRKTSSKLDKAITSIAAEAMSVDNVLAEIMRGRQELADKLRSAPKPDPSEVARLKKEIAALNKRIKDNESVAVKFTDERDSLTQEMRLHENKSSVAHGEHNLLRRQSANAATLKGRCFTCGSDLPPGKVNTYIKEITKALRALDESIFKYDADAQEVRAKRSTVDEDIRLNASERVRLHTALNTASTKLTELELHTSVRDGIRKALAEKDERAIKWRKAKSIHEDARTATLMEKAFVDTCAAACGRDGLPAFLCAAAAPRLNASAAVFREAFGSEVSVLFRSAADGIDVGSYGDQSKGEASMAGIITALAFRDALVPLGVLILDEPGEGLDAQSAAAFARGMNAVAARFGSAYVITHNPAILAGLEPDRHVEVTKIGRISEAREIV